MENVNLLSKIYLIQITNSEMIIVFLKWKTIENLSSFKNIYLPTLGMTGAEEHVTGNH